MPDKQKEYTRAKHLQPYFWPKGVSGNPKGRPPEKTMREYVREALSRMTEDERAEFLGRIPPEVIWKMGEGDYSQVKTINITVPRPILGGVASTKLESPNESTLLDVARASVVDTALEGETDTDTLPPVPKTESTET